jgi:hypothetical protein
MTNLLTISMRNSDGPMNVNNLATPLILEIPKKVPSPPARGTFLIHFKLLKIINFQGRGAPAV